MKYFDELKRSMDWLNEQPNTLFLGQAVEYAGTGMTNTLKDVDRNKMLEMPVNEDMQMGLSLGIALNGALGTKICDLVDKVKIMSDGGYTPKVIIRTSIGSQRPLHPQHQHIADFTSGFRAMCETVDIIRLEEPNQIFEAYQYAYNRTDDRSTILVEYGDYYNEK